MNNFKNRLKELRESEGISLKQLSLVLGVSDAAICKWENGVAEPKVTYLIKLSNYFDCTIDYLVGKTDDFDLAAFPPKENVLKLTAKEKQLILSIRQLSPNLKLLLQDTVDAWNKSEMNDER